MKCSHCHQDIPGKECPHCGSTIPLESHYCMDCGGNLGEETEETIEQDNGIDLEDRVLCSDGACTGIIIDGKCSECGKPPKD